jgi:PIN domain nuclease of toxin-antitoxin system
VTLLDAYALVALVADEPAAQEVEEILRAGGARVVVVNLAEAIYVAQRVHAISAEDTRAALEPLFLGDVVSAVVSDELRGWLAAELRVRHYDKKTTAVSLADCFLLAHGLADGGPIATADPPVAAIAESEGVDVIGLPDSSGRRPT